MLDESNTRLYNRGVAHIESYTIEPRKIQNMKLATRSTHRRRSTAEKAERAELQKQAVQRLHALLVEYKTRMTPEQQQAIDEAADKLEGYSIWNKVLIALQSKQKGFVPSAVAAASSWHKAGHIIRKDETAIRILAPIMRRKAKPEDGSLVPADFDFEAEDARTKAPIWFKAVPVFDISQTEEADKTLRIEHTPDFVPTPDAYEAEFEVVNA